MGYTVRIIQLGRDIVNIYNFVNIEDAKLFAFSFSRLYNYHFWVDNYYLTISVDDYVGEEAPFDIQIVSKVDQSIYSIYEREGPNGLVRPSSDDFAILGNFEKILKETRFASINESRIKHLGYKVAEPKECEIDGKSIRAPVIFVSEEKLIYVLECGGDSIHQISKEQLALILKNSSPNEIDQEGHNRFIKEFN